MVVSLLFYACKSLKFFNATSEKFIGNMDLPLMGNEII